MIRTYGSKLVEVTKNTSFCTQSIHGQHNQKAGQLILLNFERLLRQSNCIVMLISCAPPVAGVNSETVKS